MKIFLLALMVGVVLAPSVFACSTNPISGTDLIKGSLVEIDPKKSEKATVVVFLSAKCPCSKSHEPALTKLAEEFPEFRFVAVHSNSDEDENLSAFHFKESGLSFPVVQDKGAKIANAFGALKTPHAYIVGKSGECLFNGGVDDSKMADKATKHYLKQALVDIRLGREPQEKEVRTLGCIIKR